MNIKDIIKNATPGRWYFEESDMSQQMFASVDDRMHPKQMFKAPKRGTDFAEYWLTEGDKRFIAEMNPTHAALMESVLRRPPYDNVGNCWYCGVHDGESHHESCDWLALLDYRKERGLDG